MLTQSNKEDIRDNNNGYAVEEIAEILNLDECSVLYYVDDLEREQTNP